MTRPPASPRVLSGPAPPEPFFRLLPGSAPFLHAIAEQPDDELTRLVFADWLDDAGFSSRAEFLRLQCSLVRTPPWDPRRKALHRREEALLEEHASTWLGDLPSFDIPGWPAKSHFRRGLLEEVSANASAVAEVLERASAFVDVKGLRVGSQLHPGAAPLLDSAPDALARLDVSWSHLADRGLMALLRCPGLRQLRELEVGGNHISTEGGMALAGAPHLADLSALDLGVNTLRDRGAEALASSPYLRRLASLNLHGNGLGPAAAEALAGAANLAGLEVLDVGVNALGDAGAVALARSPHLRHLTHLNLATNDIGDAGVKALAGSPALAKLECLVLRSNRVGRAGLEALAASPYLTRLACLNLRCCPDAAGAEGVLRCPALPNLVHLEMDPTPRRSWWR